MNRDMDIHLIGFDTEEHANEIGALVSQCLTGVMLLSRFGFIGTRTGQYSH